MASYKEENTEIARRLVSLYLGKETPRELCLSEQSCRLERFEYKNRVVYTDVCHNEQGLKATLHALNCKVAIVCGFSKTKDINKMISIMA